MKRKGTITPDYQSDCSLSLKIMQFYEIVDDVSTFLNYVKYWLSLKNIDQHQLLEVVSALECSESASVSHQSISIYGICSATDYDFISPVALCSS